MLQEGHDFIALKTLYKKECVRVFYKIYNEDRNVIFLHTNIAIIDDLPITWTELLTEHSDFQDIYKGMAECNNLYVSGDFPQKTLCVETHIESEDHIQLVYINDCIPSLDINFK